MALIGDFKTLNFSMAVEDESAHRFRVGEEATLSFDRTDFSKIYDTVYEAGNAGKHQQFTARIVEITPDFSEPAAIRKILWEVDNRAGLLEPQTYNSVSVQSFNPYECLTIPISALADSSRSSVFVVNEDGFVARKSIIAGSDDGSYVEILGGLSEGETVVTSGTDGLEDGMKATVTLEEGEVNG